VLDTSLSETIHDLPPYSDWDEIKCAQITGPDDALEEIIGFKPGDALIVQPMTTDGTGIQHIIKVASILFHPAGYNSYLILKCKPVDFDTINYRYPYVANHFFGWSDFAKPIAPLVPNMVRATADSVSTEYGRLALATDRLSVSVQPLRYLKEMYFAVVASYSEGKGFMGSLWVIDSSGKIIYRSDSLYQKILGITDVDRDDVHELLLLWGSGVAGGVQAMCLQYDYATGKPKAYLGQRFWTMSD
jgi:hypothetical protein